MHPNERARQRQQKRAARYAENSDSYAFFNILTGPEFLEKIESALPEHRERLVPPTETLSMFLAQSMASDRSCQAAVNDAAVKRLVGGLPSCSTSTGAYCRSRSRLPTEMVAVLSQHTGAMIAEQVPQTWHWRGRPVRLVDGATTTLPDTEDNQKCFPQPGSQKPGLGFPIARIVAITCLSSGALLNAAIGPCQGKGSDEQSLLREILNTLTKGDVLLGDAFYGTYFLLCELQKMGVAAVFEQFGARRKNTDFRCGQRLGPRDHLITLTKPVKRPSWMSEQAYASAPPTLNMRELDVGHKLLLTTFLCPKTTRKNELKALYRERWHVELDLRNIKTTLGMEMMSCRTPEMVEKEIWVFLLAYNIIRLLMAQSAILADITPRQLSFKHTLQLWVSWRHSKLYSDEQLAVLFMMIAQQRVGKRPGRVEPRAVKRRPKPFPLLTKPRTLAREDVRRNGHPKKLK